MSLKRESRPVEIAVIDGGRLAPDVPPDRLSAADYTVKRNWRYDSGYEVEREGWQDWQPNSAIAASVSRVMGAASVEQVGEAVRANGETVPVGVANGKIYWFSWTNGLWTEIGTGYSTTPARRWQILNTGGYVVFNNGTDLPCTWVIGDAAVKPIYELREQGYACVGEITASNNMLLCWDITEILPAELDGIMNGGSPYGIVAADKVQRYAYRKVWSNIGNPRDFAAVVNGSGADSQAVLTLAWPMASFEAGDEVIVVGAGTLGGNLTTTILSIDEEEITLATNILTTVSGAAVFKSAALNSIVGFLDLEDDGSEVMRALPLQNRVVAYKSSGQIFLGYYTGDLDEPWIYDRVYSATGESRGLRFPYTLVDVAGRHHLYAGDRHFYTFSLGDNEPQIHSVLQPCEQALFFTPAAALGATARTRIFAAMNGCTSEVFFFVPGANEAAGSVLAYDFANARASSIDAAGFTSAATIRRPIGAASASREELWFLLGRDNGHTALYGASNLTVITRARFGAAFDRVLESGLIHFGAPFEEKDVRSYVVVADQVAALTVVISATDRPSKAVSTLATVSLNGTSQPTIHYLHARRAYFKDRITCAAGVGLRISSRMWDAAIVPARGQTKT